MLKIEEKNEQNYSKAVQEKTDRTIPKLSRIEEEERESVPNLLGSKKRIELLHMFQDRSKNEEN